MKATALLVAASIVTVMMVVTPASADTIDWTNWSTNTAGSIVTPQTAISVTYSGELSGLSINYPTWTPSTR